MNQKEQKLYNLLLGYARSLKEGWISYKGTLANLLIVLHSAGYLKKTKEVYEKTIK